MKKLALVLMGILLCFSLSACGEKVTPVAYTRFAAVGSQYVYYSSDVYGLEHGQIEVYKDEEEFGSNYPSVDITFKFSRCLGADTLNDVKYTLVDLSNKGVYLTVYILKSSEIYSADKKIYLNGVALVPTSTWEGDTLISFTYEGISSFARTNPNGKIDDSKVNTLEYR